MAKQKNKQKKNKIEREYVIPLRKKFKHVPRYKKTNKAVKTIKEFLARHMKIYDRDLNKIKIDKYLNEFLWFRGIRKPPAKVKVKVVKEDDIVNVELLEMPEKLKFKKAREEKRDKKAKEQIEKKKKLIQRPEKEEKPEEEKKKEDEKKAALAEANKEQAEQAAKQAKHQAGVEKQKKKPQKRKQLSR